MPRTAEDLFSHFRQQRAELLASIEGLTDLELTEPTLDGWSIKDHLLHIALWDDMRAEEASRISAGQDSAWRMTEAHADAYNEMAYELRRELSLAQARWELEASRERLLRAIAAATPRGLDASLYGEAPIMSTHEAEHAGWIREWRARRDR
jgi:uncharacterized damage-inducible protein DinB